MASLGHDLSGTVWFDVLPPSLSLDFFRDRSGLSNYRFPFLFSLFALFRWFWPNPPSCIYIFFFFNIGSKRREFQWSANLVGMSLSSVISNLLLALSSIYYDNHRFNLLFYGQHFIYDNYLAYCFIVNNFIDFFFF